MPTVRYWCAPTVRDLRLGSATFVPAFHEEAAMPTEPVFFVPAAEQDALRITSPMPSVAMHLVAYGDGAEASLRQFCSGHLPVVGQCYVWVCTGVHTEAGKMWADFQLMPLDAEQEGA